MTEPSPVAIRTDFIPLDAFLKWAGLADSGAQAKNLVRSGGLTVNGQPEHRPGRKLVAGDLVALDGQSWRVVREDR